MNLLAGPDAPRAAARLLIHADDGDARGPTPFAAALHRLRSRQPAALKNRCRARLSLVIEDLVGKRLCVIDSAGLLTELPLPPGTYHVTVAQGGPERRYTMTLLPGVAFDLHLGRSHGG